MAVCLEDSGLILGAEAPLRVWLWVHNPGNTSVGWGLLVRIRWFQLPNKETGLGAKAQAQHDTSRNSKQQFLGDYSGKGTLPHWSSYSKLQSGRVGRMGTDAHQPQPLVPLVGRRAQPEARPLYSSQTLAEDTRQTKGRAHRESISRKERVSHRQSKRPPGYETAHGRFREPDTQDSGNRKDLDSRTKRRQW